MRKERVGITGVIRHHWDRKARTFDDETGHSLVSEEQRRAWLEVLSRLAGSPPQRVLDVGCGTGFLALRFAELGHTVTGIDLSPEMIQRARRKAEQTSQDLELRVGDAAALDIADATYDLVVARHVIWNLPDPQRGLAEWLRVLRPGGRLALIEGKWADNQSLAQAHSRPASRLLARVVDVAAALTLRIGRHPRKLLGRQYWRLEARLPFSGGIEAARLAEFLGVNGLRDVAVEPLMDPVLWGEPPRFPRYLATGARSEGEQPG